jgi:hypothetical protein
MNTTQLPKIPKSIKALRQINGELQEVDAVVFAGLNVIGEDGYVCPTVTLLYVDSESGDMRGWSLCLGCPDQCEAVPYYFEICDKSDFKGKTRGTEIPNAIIYFQAEIDPDLTLENVAIEKLDEIFAYVLPYISDEGPPPPAFSEEAFDQIISEETNEWANVQAKELLAKAEILLDKFVKDFSGEKYSYWILFDELNRRFNNNSELQHAWKHNLNDSDYNSNSGIVEKQIGGKTVRICIGLPSDGLNDVCVIIQITPYDN